MDEFRQVRELYEDLHGERSAPAPEVIERTRSALRAGERPRRRPNNTVAVVVAAAAVAGVTAALVVPALVPGPGGRDVIPATSAPTPDRLPSATAVLERAANAAEQWAKPAGTMWRVRTLTGSTAEVESAARGLSYELDVRTVHECWTPQASDGCAITGFRELGAEPLTAEDERAWRQDDSPPYWKVRIDGTVDGVSAQPGEGELAKSPDLLLVSPRPTVPLPAEPSIDSRQLRDTLVRLHRKSTQSFTTESWLYQSALELLFERPGSPSVDAAVFGMLANLEGLTVRGHASDGIGREGVALELRGEPDLPELLVDLDTGELLGANFDGNCPSYRVRLDAGWTDEKPKPPSVR